MNEDLEYINCPVCNSPHWEKVYVAKDYLYSLEVFTVVRCNSCGLLYTNPRVPQDKIGDYYFHDYFQYKKKDSAGILRNIKAKFNSILRGYQQKLLKELESISAKNVLEVGPGYGELLFFLKKLGFRVTGCEKDRGCMERIRQSNIPCYLGDLNDVIDEISSEKFDAVIFHHVFEHLYVPIRTLNSVHKLLSDDGKLFLALPNSASIEAKIFGKYWKGLDLPRHLVHYEAKTIEKTLCISGFKIKQLNAGVFPSSFIESIGFRFFENRKLPKLLYLTLYYPLKLLQLMFTRLIGSGVMEIVAVKKR